VNANQDTLDGMAETFAIFITGLLEMEDALNTVTHIAYEQAAITGKTPTDYSGQLAVLDVLQSKVEMAYYQKRDNLKGQIEIQQLKEDNCDQL
jgi:hypothetical protein